MSELSRRNLLMGTALVGAAGAFGLPRAKAVAAPDPGQVGQARWLEGQAPAATPGVTWGMPWPRGRFPARTGDAGLAARAWQEFNAGHAGYGPNVSWQTTRVDPPLVPAPVDETDFVSTNASAQYGLAAIQCLALVGDHLS